MSKKAKFLIIFLTFVIFLLVSLIGFFFYGLGAVGNSEQQIYVLHSGTSKITIADELKMSGLIRSSLALKVYFFFHSDLNLQAGTYELSGEMTPKEMVLKMKYGDVKNDSVKVTLIEGRRLKEYVSTLAKELSISEDTFLSLMADHNYLNQLIEKYWFLDEAILNSELYYPLEGYLMPDTYEFKEMNTAEEVIETILAQTGKKLETLKDQIDNSNFSVHEILSMGSIIELEAVSEGDRKTVSQVIYKRLNNNMGLGMDVTTYYAVKKEMGEGLTLSDLKTVSPYNTSQMNVSMTGKLPVGPICNPSLMSIEAVLNPSDTDYLYFFADVKTGIVYFTNTYEEHLAIQKEIG